LELAVGCTHRLSEGRVCAVAGPCPPARWGSFIPDLVGAAKQSESLCENCMNILKLLSEEVFDFSRGELTQAKIIDLKNALNTDFPMVGRCRLNLWNPC
jgi:hypothetical protein